MVPSGVASNMTAATGKRRKPTAHPSWRGTHGSVRTTLPSAVSQCPPSAISRQAQERGALARSAGSSSFHSDVPRASCPLPRGTALVHCHRNCPGPCKSPGQVASSPHTHQRLPQYLAAKTPERPKQQSIKANEEGFQLRKWKNSFT